MFLIKTDQETPTKKCLGPLQEARNENLDKKWHIEHSNLKVIFLGVLKKDPNWFFSEILAKQTMFCSQNFKFPNFYIYNKTSFAGV